MSSITRGAVALSILLVLSACSGGDDDGGSDVTTAEFCADAARVMVSARSVDVGEFSAEFFSTMDADFATLEDSAPTDLVDDISVMRDGFGLTSEIFDEFGQSSTNASFVQALTDRLDTQAMLVADQRINDHLDASCEAIVLQEARAPGGFNFDRSDPAGGVANIMEAFATDEDTARCIFEAWGDVSQVPPEELTPELFNYEICGTSIFALISGDNRFTGQGG